MVQFKKAIAGVLSAVVMIASLGINVDAAKVGSTSVMTSGGTEGKLTLVLSADKEYFTAATAGYNGYKYGATISLFPSPALADGFEIVGKFCTSTTTHSTSRTASNVNSYYMYTQRAEGSNQYISAQFSGYLTSSEYGDKDIYLNVTY